MWKTNIITILGLIWFSCAAAEFKTLLNKKETTDNGKFKFVMMKDTLPKDRQFFVYGICQINRLPTTDCKIIRQPLNGKNNGSSCRVSFKGVTSKEILTLHDFDDDKVIVYWLDHEYDELPNYYIRFTIVPFPNCSTAEAKIRFDAKKWRDLNYGRSLGAILPNGENFTVAFDNSGLFGNKIDEQTFDVRGNVISTATTSFKPLNKESFMFMYNCKNGNYAILEIAVDSRQLRFSLLNENGVKVLNLSTFEDFETTDYAISVLHDTLRLCHLNGLSSKIDCVTFTGKGKFISSSALQSDLKNIVDLAVHNLIDGSFFVITTSVTSKISEKLFYLSKFSADGKLQTTMELPGYKCNGKITQVIPYENEKDQHCVMRYCINEYVNYKITEEFDVIVKCFSDEDVK